MKLIEDEKLNINQVEWFEKQKKSMDVDNFNATGINEKDIAIREAMNGLNIIQVKHLPKLRTLLNEKGIKRLSNSLASARKRVKSNKKSLQVMLKPSTIILLEALVKSKGMTLSEYLEGLVSQ